MGLLKTGVTLSSFIISKVTIVVAVLWLFVASTSRFRNLFSNIKLSSNGVISSVTVLPRRLPVKPDECPENNVYFNKALDGYCQIRPNSLIVFKVSITKILYLRRKCLSN